MGELSFPNHRLIGQPGSGAALVTPALVVDLAAFERNLAAMAGRVRAAGRNLRPHAKGPKSAEVARRQIAAGAVGIACATLFEAETLAAAGIGGLLLTSPVVQPAQIERLVALDARCDGGVIAVVDCAFAVERLAAAAAAAAARRRLRVLIDLDVGQKRTGVADAGAAVSLVGRIGREAALEFGGVQAYYGHLQGLAAFAEREAACRRAMDHVAGILTALRRAGHEAGIVTGGGTGTCAIDLAAGLFTEVQPGSYPFMDAAYARVDIAGDGRPVFETSLFIETTVVSANVPGQVTVDAGMKAVPTDGPPVRVVAGAPAQSTYSHAGDEFGFVRFPEGEAVSLVPGDRVRLATPHCDTSCNLHADLHVLDGDRLAAIWPIAARGRW